MKSVVLVAIASLVLTSCAGLRRNVSGSWQCGAGKGTCAPVSTIDEAAVGRIGSGAAPPRFDQTSVAPPPPSGLLAPFTSDRGLSRSPERTLRVMFPGGVDSHGVYHEPSAVHIVVDRASWVSGPSLTGRSASAASISPSSIPSSPRLATPEEAARLLASARPSSVDPKTGATPASAAQGFPPFPAPAAAAPPAAPAALPTGAAGAPSSSTSSVSPAPGLPPVHSSPVEGPSHGQPAFSGGKDGSPFDSSVSGARALNLSEYHRISAAPAPPSPDSSATLVLSDLQSSPSSLRLSDVQSPTLVTPTAFPVLGPGLLIQEDHEQ